MRFVDSASLKGVRRLADGYLATEAYAVRTGVQLYSGKEIGMPERAVVRVYRPESEVRAPDSLTSFSHAPVTVGHPKESVTADNWKRLAVGEVSTEAEWHDGKIKLPLILKDAGAIQLVEGGVRELSAGYTCELEIADGVTPEGEAYDAIQKNIRINHLAIVPRGRAGSECRIGDAAQWGQAPIAREGNDMSFKTIVLGDQAVSVSAEHSAIVEKFRDESRSTIADRDSQLATRDARIADLEKKLADAEQRLETLDVDALVEARSALVDKVRAVDSKIEVKGVSDADLRRAAVVKHYGKQVADKSDDYIATAFDLIEVGDKQRSSKVADGIIVRSAAPINDEDFGHGDYVKSLQDGWKQTAKEG